jgi:hypothetical protein
MTDHPLAPTAEAAIAALAGFGEHMKNAAAEAAAVMARHAERISRIGPEMKRLSVELHEQANDPVHVAGVCARYFVRGAMDPAYANHSDMMALRHRILRGWEPGTALMTVENRREVVLALVSGWADPEDWIGYPSDEA